MRRAGVLLHISSLPNKYGIGTLGREAYDFVDFLKRSGQSIWQILPIGPTSYGDSPYQALSAFGLNPYFIDFEELVKDKLLSINDLPPVEEKQNTIDYGKLFVTRYNILHKAYLNKHLVKDKFEKFQKEEQEWLIPYSEYMVLKQEHENKSWNLWYDDFKFKVDHAMAWFRNEYKDKIEEWQFYQFLFFTQWKKLKRYANKNGIKIMGDMPIYCAFDSCDVWNEPTNFQLDSSLNPIAVAGCPPDAFSETGQLWGNPLYDYEKMALDNYSWWVKRVKHSFKLFDIIRIDHFRGFAGYYSIPYGNTTAVNGTWKEGPGYSLFKEIKKACPKGEIVAENLGLLTDDVFELMDKCGYPGMNIFQFELGDRKENIPLKKKYDKNNIFYSGTHDNQLISSFYNELNSVDKKIVDELCDIKFTDRPNLKIIEFCMNETTDTCIIPIQDYIGLSDNEGRMNTPSTATGNWCYRLEDKWMSQGLEEYIYDITKKSNRLIEE